MVLPVLLFAERRARYGITALTAALESVPLPGLVVHVSDDAAALTAAAGEWARAHPRVVVGMTLFTAQRRAAADLVQRLRQTAGPTLLAVAGGPHASGDPLSTLAAGFDLAVLGEAEGSFPALLTALVQGQDLATVPGLAWLEAGSLRCTGPAPAVDLDAHPPHAPTAGLFGPIELTRGCPFACSYCQTASLFGQQVRHRSVPAVVAAVRLLRQRGFRDLRFIAPDAFAYGSATGRSVELERLEGLLSACRTAMGPSGRIFFGSFPSEVRPEHVVPEALALVRRLADNRRILIGAQTGSPRLLRAAHRGHTIEHVLTAVERIRQAGFAAHVDVMAGLPGETPADAEATLDLCRRIVALGGIIHTHAFMPLPGTPWADQPAAPINPRLRAEFVRLAGAGTAWGTWEAQERVAHEPGGG